MKTQRHPTVNSSKPTCDCYLSTLYETKNNTNVKVESEKLQLQSLTVNCQLSIQEQQVVTGIIKHCMSAHVSYGMLQRAQQRVLSDSV